MSYTVKLEDITCKNDEYLSDLLWCEGTLCITDRKSGKEFAPCTFLYQPDTEILHLSVEEELLTLPVNELAETLHNELADLFGTPGPREKYKSVMVAKH